MLCAGRPGERVLDKTVDIFTFRGRYWRSKVHERPVVVRIAKTVERCHGLLQRIGGRHEYGAVRGCYGTRLPDQPHTRTSQGQRSARRGRRQRETIVGSTRGVHIYSGTVPSAVAIHVRHCRSENRPGHVVREGRVKEHRHHVPDDRLSGVRREVPGAHQRYACQRSNTGALCRRRNRPYHTNHRTRSKCLVDVQGITDRPVSVFI